MTALEYYLSKKWRVTSSYGPRIHPVTGAQSYHYGVDFGIPRGGPLNAPVPTPFAGIVTARGTYGGRGKTVAVRITGTDIVQLFQHLHDYRCKVGDKLPVGGIVGLCGTTGTSTAVHLHYELRYAGNPWGDVWGDPARFKLPGNSNKFAAGQWVRVADRINVRESPGTGTRIINRLEPGAVRQILDNPVGGMWADGYHWWRLIEGWVAENWLERAGAPEEPEPDPEPDPEPPQEEPPEPDLPEPEPEPEPSPPEEPEPPGPEPEPEPPEEPEPTPGPHFWTILINSLVEVFRMMIDSLRGRQP